MSRHVFELGIVVDDEALEAWKSDPRSNLELPVPSVDEWELRDVVAAARRGIVDELESEVISYEAV